MNNQTLKKIIVPTTALLIGSVFASVSFAETTAPATPAASPAKQSKVADPAKVAYKAALAKYKTDLAAYRAAASARKAARAAANNNLKTALAAAKTKEERVAARSAHTAAIAALPTLPAKPVKPTAPAATK